MSFDPHYNPQKPQFGHASDDERMWAMFAHLSPFVGLSIFGPLIIWMIKKDESAFVDDQGKEALNFHLSALIAVLATAVTCIGPFIVSIIAMVYHIMAAVEANKGVCYRYPYTLRLIK